MLLFPLLLAEEEKGEEDNHPSVTEGSNSNHALGPDEAELDSEAELMRRMGLPLQFGGQSALKEFVVKPILLLFLGIST